MDFLDIFFGNKFTNVSTKSPLSIPCSLVAKTVFLINNRLYLYVETRYSDTCIFWKFKGVSNVNS